MRSILALLIAASMLPFANTTARALETDESSLCQLATATAEHVSGVPDQLLDAISRVESGRYDDVHNAVRAWPWTINEEGQGHFYRSKSEAVDAAKAFRARGIQSMDVGCTQINLMYHPTAFASLDDAFDPQRNAAYAARFLTELFHQVGSWPHAAAAYHSQTPELGTDYQRKVLEAWADPINGAGPPPPHSSRTPESGLADFHRQLASLSTNDHAAHATFGSLASPAAFHPFGRSGPMGGAGHVMRTGGGQMSFTGRSLSAYRAMPVAMLTRPPRPGRY